MTEPLVQHYIREAPRPGPEILMLGAVHGDGTAGTIALRQFIDAIDNGGEALALGRLVAVPVANPAAYQLKKRLVTQNMNRLFMLHPLPKCDEERAVNDILPLIDRCDVLLDIHSCHRLPKAFAFLDHDTPDNRRLAAALGFETICTGWKEVYQAEGIDAPGAIDYAHSKGKITAFAECGWHDEPDAIAAAAQSIRRCLTHFGMLPPKAEISGTSKDVMFERRIVRESSGALARDWRHLDACRKGERIARYDDGRDITAPRDGYILFPTPDADVGEAWFYFGKDNGNFRS